MCTEYNLQPCPKCGEKDDIHIVVDQSWSIYHVMCWGCNYEARRFSSKDGAVQHWNRMKREGEVSNES